MYLSEKRYSRALLNLWAEEEEEEESEITH